MAGRERRLARLQWTLIIGAIVFAASAAAGEAPPIMADSRGQTAVNLSIACMATKPRCALCSSKTRCKTCEDGFKLGACSFCLPGHGVACDDGSDLTACPLLNLTCTKCQDGAVSTGGRAKPPCTKCQDGFVPNSLQTKCIKVPAGGGGGGGGDGPPCNITAQTGCSVAHASCVYNTSSPVDGTTMCACDEGYAGDGYTKCAPCRPACTSPGSMCGLSSAGKPKCVCDEATGFTGDGQNCTLAEKPCEPQMVDSCGPHGTCIVYSWRPNSVWAPLNASCECDHGYSGHGKDCTEIVYTCSPPCGANANCLPSFTDPKGTFCACKNGFEGDPLVGCTQNVFNCQADCSPDAICQDLPGGHKCTCKPGYNGNGINCTLTNESFSTTSSTPFCDPPCGDNSHCVFNGAGMLLTCQCNDHYFNKDGLGCKYYDKCWPPCSGKAMCVTELNGTHRCHCGPDMFDAGSGNCTRGSCTEGHYQCAQGAYCTPLSADIGGPYQCNCFSDMIGDGKNNCTSRNLCQTSQTKCDPNAVCNPIMGSNPDGSDISYTCKCKDSFLGNGFDCRNVTGPCTPGSGACSPLATCTTNMNSFQCKCNSGLYGDGSNCTVLSGPPPPPSDGTTDEGPCDRSRGLCSANATCMAHAGMGSTNPEYFGGMYTCMCKMDYVGDGQTCLKSEDWPGDPCANNECFPGATCTKRGPSYTCTCPKGSYGDGFIKCTPYPSGHPCSLSGYLCDPVNAQCWSYVMTGGFHCACNPGTGGDGYVCTPGAAPLNASDPNGPCSPGKNRCSPNAWCVVNDGVYTNGGGGGSGCHCNYGYVGDGINCTKSGNNTQGPPGNSTGPIGRRLQGWEQPAVYHSQAGATPWAVLGLSDGLGAEEGARRAQEGAGGGPGALAEEGAAVVGTASLGREGIRPHVARADAEGGRAGVGNEE